MSKLKQVPTKGDPSDILQLFPQYNLQLLCCRCWWLKRWEFRELAFPYWRIYHNMKEGAVLHYNGIDYPLLPDKIYLIAPNTSYSTRLFDHPIPGTGYALEGERIGIKNSQMQKDHCVQHLFIHFNIGMPYDNVSPGVFSFQVNDHLREKLEIIRRHLNVDSTQFSFYSFLAIQSLISDLLSEIKEDNWQLLAKDFRILKVLSHIETNIHEELSNDTLSDLCRMATNAFTRLFKDETRLSPQRFVRQKRVNAACILLHHSNESIDAIATRTGFANRYHFTRIFSESVGLSPAKYRKEFGVK